MISMPSFSKIGILKRPKSIPISLRVKFTYCKDDYREDMGRGLSSKLLVLCKPEDTDATYTKIEEALGHELKIIRGSPHFFVEILNKDVCKGNGLELLSQKLKVGLHECL